MFELSTIISALLVLLIIVFVLREVACWYWKINEIVRLLTNIDKKLDRISFNSLNQTGFSINETASTMNETPLKREIPGTNPFHSENIEDGKPCPHCGAIVNPTAKICIYCNKMLT